MSENLLVEMLRGFEPLDRLADSDLVVLAARTELLTASAGEMLFDQGDEDRWLLYLQKGAVTLTAADGRKHRVDAATPAAAQAMSRLKPRRYCAVAATPVHYLRIDENGLGDLRALPSEADYLVQEVSGGERSSGLSDPAGQVEASLDERDLSLPSLPVAAVQAMRVIDRDDADVATVAKVVMTDPPIAAKLIRAANSAIFYGRGEVQTCERAVSRLGLVATRQLVMAFALREIFDTSSVELRRRMEQLWEHSTQVASVAFVIARAVGGFDPNEAQLAGLLHDIGNVPVLHYAGKHPELLEDPERLDHLCRELCPTLGERVLRAWNLPEPIAIVAREAEQWWRDGSADAELADLVVVAQIVSSLGRPDAAELPPLVRLPAFTKVSRTRLAADDIMALVDEAAEQIGELQSLLHG